MLKTDRQWKREFGFLIAQIHPRDPGAEVARLQAQGVPKGLSPAQTCEFLTRGQVSGLPEAARIESDPPLLGTGAGVTKFLTPAPLALAA